MNANVMDGERVAGDGLYAPTPSTTASLLNILAGKQSCFPMTRPRLSLVLKSQSGGRDRHWVLQRICCFFVSIDFFYSFTRLFTVTTK